MLQLACAVVVAMAACTEALRLPTTLPSRRCGAAPTSAQPLSSRRQWLSAFAVGAVAAAPSAALALGFTDEYVKENLCGRLADDDPYCQQIKYNQQGAKVVDGMKELGIEARVRGAPKPLTSYERYCLALDPDSPSAVACERTLIDVANRASE